jgi:hypothetical protein
VNITAASARLEPVRSLRTDTSAPPCPSGLGVDAVEHVAAVVEDVDVAVALAVATMTDLPGDRGPYALGRAVGRERQPGLRRNSRRRRHLRTWRARPWASAGPLDERLTQLLGGDAGLGRGLA